MESNITKSTHERIELWQPIVKTPDDRYLAVLSDDSIDRDDEIVGKKALEGVMNDKGYTAILMDHKNAALSQIGEWTKKRIEKIKGFTAFLAEPKFYMSNPNAQIIKGCLDEGAKYGVSIGAIPLEWEMVERNGKEVRMYTKLELLEASFVAIPSNRHGQAFAIAKMFSKTEDKMEKTHTQKDIDDAVAKSGVGAKEEMAKVMDSNKAELEKMTTKHTEDLEKAKVEQTEAIEKMTTEHTEAVEKLAETHKGEVEKLNKDLEELKKMSVLKGDNSTEEGDEDAKAKAEAEKKISEGALPIVTKA